MPALELTADWPVPTVAAAVLVDGLPVETTGDIRRHFRLASLAKPMTAWAVLVAVEEGLLTLDTPIGQPGCTMRHLLAHAGGYPFAGRDPITEPERTRIYSNTGIEMAADAVAAEAGMPFEEYVAVGVFEPLGMLHTSLRGSPAHGVWSTAGDLVAFLREVTDPRLVSPELGAEATRPQYPELGGIVPGVGRFERSPWGLGFEIRGGKQPHWTGAQNSAATFGHFGGTGTMMWIDPDVRPSGHLGVIALTDRPFDEWGSTALASWRLLADTVIEEYAGATR
jgi:CubicO group peptidase (beta-lactamase class C family)